MTRHFACQPRHLLAPRERLAVAVVAFTASGGIAAALVLIFLGASPAEWLAPDPGLSELLAQCEQIPARHARQQCKRDIVTARLEAHKRPLVVTQH